MSKKIDCIEVTYSRRDPTLVWVDLYREGYRPCVSGYPKGKKRLTGSTITRINDILHDPADYGVYIEDVAFGEDWICFEIWRTE